MKTYAGIGSRGLDGRQLQVCFNIGRWLARQGWALNTGAAAGADAAFAEGALSADGIVNLKLPWPSYRAPWVELVTSQHPGKVNIKILNYLDKEAHESVDTFHPRPDLLTSAARGLHARNWLIIEGSKFVLAWPKRDKFGSYGGTGQGMKIADHMGIDLLNLDNPQDLKKVVKKIR